MLLEIVRQGDLCILRLQGRFATGIDPETLLAKTEEIKSSHCKKVLVDLREVASIGSTGIGFLVAIYTSVMNAGGRYVLVGLNQRVSEVLALTHLHTVLPVAEDMASGMAALQAPEHARKAEKY